jgi:hypothetical protein
MYKAAQPQSAGGRGGPGPVPEADGHAKKDEGIVDAEYVDVDEKMAG